MSFTLIARITDGVMLVASMESAAVQAQISTGKALIRELESESPRQCSVDAGGHSFHYVIQDLVVFLTLTPKSFSKNLIFAYLSELSEQFSTFVKIQSGSADFTNVISNVDRPYAFIKFDKQILALRRKYQEGTSLTSEITEVQNIMRKNIADVLGRGQKLEKAVETSSNLMFETKKFSKQAQKLNWMHMYRTYGPIVGFALLILLVAWYRLS